MFGFMNPGAQTLEYRSIYSRLCQHQRQHYGLLSMPFHSYEAVFLYAWRLMPTCFQNRSSWSRSVAGSVVEKDFLPPQTRKSAGSAFP